ncbi:winged helix-turn-helix domain-containing protein [Lutibaculum baratangense]|uniref:DNA-binding domain of ModE n=1 Tax=Lutibaculum baratangense AMV1 TaxID=631454 RepID=V4RSY2_9HYPH|nr:LysR family transcriptional regulator [Lutibaculum baratangense]ESR26240.1 DNA-binding domain of ModE [Lutibaculum baratangense AMV1]
MATSSPILGPRLRIVLRPNVAIGPGKADLLEAIRETGSISAAGRRMKMSYKRAWQLIEAMNTSFDTPLVETATGGRAGGGAVLTALGEEVLLRYRKMEAKTREVVEVDLIALRERLPAGGQTT